MTSLPPNAARIVDDVFSRFPIGDARGTPSPVAPGVAYGVVLDGVLVHSGGHGTTIVGEERAPDADTVFRIASMTKSFVAASILLLRDRGLLALDDPIARHVPEATGIVAGGDAPAITLRHLLTMSGGLPQDDPWADRNESISEDALTAILAAQATFAWTPGTAFDYSNLGFAILGRTITNVSRRPFRTFIREELIDAVGLSSTRWDLAELPADRLARGYWLADGGWHEQQWQESGAFSAIGGLCSSVRDIATWAAGYLDSWPARDGATTHPLARATRREQQALATAVPLQLELDHNGRLTPVAGGYCMGLVSSDDLATGRTVGHSGGYPGYGTHMRWHPATGIGVISLANGRYAPAWKPAADALRHLVEQLGDRRHRHPPTPAFVATQAALDHALGDPAALSALDLAQSIALDDPLERRQAAIGTLGARHGLLHRTGGGKAATPLRGSWRLEGERGAVQVHAALTPETPPRLQELEITSIAAPPPALVSAAAEVVAITADPRAVGAESLIDVARELSVLLSPCSLGHAVAGDGVTTATFEVHGRRTVVKLVLTGDAATGEITSARLEPVPPPAVPG